MTDTPATVEKRAAPLWLRVLPWLLTVGCFTLIYSRVSARAASEGLSAWAYVARFLGNADWGLWLAVMIPYSCIFFLIDSAAVWRAVSWFNAPVRYTDILPVRASSYILSMINEQVGKGAMALYLNRRNGVPGWEIGSTMVLVAIVELYQLLFFSGLGAVIDFENVRKASDLPGALPLDVTLPVLLGLAAIYAPLHLLYFAGKIFPSSQLREKPFLTAMRRAKPYQYAVLIAIKAPNLLLAVGVYSVALTLFQVDVSFTQLLAFLPIIFLAAALPLPLHAGAPVLWQVLFPSYPEVGIFSLIMHTFFVVFNALIGVVFLPRANRELFGEAA